MHILLTTGPFIEWGEYKNLIAEIGVGGVKKYLFRAVLGSDRPNSLWKVGIGATWRTSPVSPGATAPGLTGRVRL